MNIISSLPYWLMAQAEAETKGPPTLTEGLGQMLPMFLVLGFLFYFFMVRPQKKEQNRRAEMLANIKKNDKIVTYGGIYGTVVSVRREANEIVLKVDEDTNCKLKMALTSIDRVLGDESEEPKESKT